MNYQKLISIIFIVFISIGAYSQNTKYKVTHYSSGRTFEFISLTFEDSKGNGRYFGKESHHYITLILKSGESWKIRCSEIRYIQIGALKKSNSFRGPSTYRGYTTVYLKDGDVMEGKWDAKFLKGKLYGGGTELIGELERTEIRFLK